MTKKFELTVIAGNILKYRLECILEKDDDLYNASCKDLDQYGVGTTIPEAVQMLERNIISLYFDLLDTPKGSMNEDWKRKWWFMQDLFVERPEKPKQDIPQERPKIVEKLEDAQYNKFKHANLRMPDKPANPNYYSRWPVEPLAFISANNLDFLRGNIIKYIMRYDAKGGLEDLIKARYYLSKLIEKENRDNGK